ncbi:MAG: MaoC/PaaZ C-terminal domain-containing protein [Ilumatobacteraceae bacterium]
MGDLQTWTVTALNLPEHARNAIHTDAGAQAAGFPKALVAGVTTYAYLAHPPAAAWGLDWVRTGGGEVRFLAPVFEGDEIECRPERGVVGAFSDRQPGPHATFEPVPAGTYGPDAPSLRDGEALPDEVVRLTDELGPEYGLRCGDDLGLFVEAQVVHPAVWPAIGNRITHAHVVRGSWIHTRSIIRHHALAHEGDTATVRSRVVRRFQTTTGERAVLDLVIEVDGRPIASLEHEAIVALNAS